MFNPHLPTIKMVAGDTCPMRFRALDLSNSLVEFGGCIAYLSLSPYVNESDTPIYSARTSVITDGELSFEIPARVTVDLRGKYVYQLFLSNGRESEIYTGHLIIYANRHKSVVT